MYKVEIYRNGQYEMARNFKDKRLALALVGFINRHDDYRKRKAIIVY